MDYFMEGEEKIMPIDKDLTIQPKKEKKKYKINIKDICLIITTCISIITPFFALYEVRNQKLQYELEKANYENDIKKLELEMVNYENAVHGLEIEKANYENDVQRLEMEKNNYENMLKENEIQLRSSYISCDMDYIKMLFDSLADMNEVKILSNDITEIFYDEKQKEYLHTSDIRKNDVYLNNRYGNDLYINVYFLKIELISNRFIQDVNINFKRIETEDNIEEGFGKFEYIKKKEFYQYAQDISIQVGDMQPNDIILIPVVLEYSNYNSSIDYESSFIEEGYFVYDDDAIIYKKIFVPQSVICYDNFCEEDKFFDIRDVLDDSLITSFYHQEQG